MAMENTVDEEQLCQFVGALRQHTTFDLSDYSERSLRRRIAKLLDDEHIPLSTLLQRIALDPCYGERVMNRITVNTSELFRDPPVWITLRRSIYPSFRTHSQINVWHAGCSMGQEVYSDMMLLNELGLLEHARICASDINSDILGQAALGCYRYRFNLSYLDNFDRVINTNPLNYEEKPEVPYSKYFTIDKERDEIRMHDFLRQKIRFRRNDLVRCANPFFMKFDIIFCRNVVIYFNNQLQNRIFEMFYQNLYPGGVLVLGLHESIVGLMAERYSRMAQVYVRRDSQDC
jgi:cheR methyltransferase, SAM binding domain